MAWRISNLVPLKRPIAGSGKFDKNLMCGHAGGVEGVKEFRSVERVEVLVWHEGVVYLMYDVISGCSDGGIAEGLTAKRKGVDSEEEIMEPAS